MSLRERLAMFRLRREFVQCALFEWVFVAAALSLGACSGAQNEQAPAESATAAEEPGTSDAPVETPPAEAPPAETEPPVAAQHGKRAPCSSDQSCNENPAVSALWGRCTEMGVCECNAGFERSPTSDLCRPVGAR
jgi:hypothetical protein